VGAEHRLKREMLTLEGVRSIVESERGDKSGSMPWTSRFLDQADQQSGGRWSEAVLSGHDASRIVLPPHAGEPCRGDQMQLVPEGGATVAEVAAALRATRNDYERGNRECWSRIARAATTPFSTVVLTTMPLDLPEYRSLVTRAGALYHLDGFHRLVGWAWAGRLVSGATVRAIVADMAPPLPRPRGPGRRG
jgi:hypothetical protein